MKKFLFFLMLVATIIFESCVSEDDENKTPTNCTLTLYANGGSMTEGDSGSNTKKTYTVAYTGELRLPSAEDLGLTYPGFQFTGWSTDAASAESEYGATLAIKLYSDVSLYAVWKATGTKTYYISETGSDNAGDGSETNPYSTLNKAIEEINSDYVDYVFVISGTITVTTISFLDETLSWVRAKSILIKGQNGAESDSLKGDGSSSLFMIGTVVPVTFSNISLTGGNGFSFAGNTVGGAVYISSVSNGSTDVTFYSVSFSENSANYGAAVYNSTGSTIISDCIFTKNSSTKAGGAIYNEGVMTLKNSTISSNISQNSAGGVYNKGTLTLTNTEITENEASIKGAGLYNAGKTTLTASSSISKNTSRTGAGVFNASSGTFILENGKIFENEADELGSGILNEGIATITGGTITDNVLMSSTSYGTGIYNSGEITLSGVILKNHNASTYGAGLYNDENGTAFFSGSTISKNSSENGGAFYNAGNLTIQGGEITSNSASVSGGAIYSTGTLVIKKCDINSNTSQNGGAIALYGEESSCIFSYGTISKNNAENGGGLYIAAGAELELSEDSDLGYAQIIDNIASCHGGGIYISSGSANITEGVISAYGRRVASSVYGGGSAYYYSGNKAGENRSSISDESYSGAGNSWFNESGNIIVNGVELTGTTITVEETTCSYSDEDVIVGVTDWAVIN